MPSSRRIVRPFAAITILILLSVFTVILLGEGFKKFGVGTRDGVKFKRRDTITFSMPWNPPLANPKPEAKAISPASGSILDAVEKVAAALLGGGTDIANFAQGAENSLASTVLAGAPSQVPGKVQDVNSQVDQATGVVGGIVSAATSIVGSLMAGTGAAGSTSAVGERRNASAGGNSTAGITRSPSGLNSSSSTSSMAFNITSAPVLTDPPSTSGTTACASIPTCTACPAPSTETCTVTETWHSTHYESTATFFSFVAAFTYTCTETVSVCPKPSLYPPAPPNTTSPSAIHPPLIACANGALAKREEDCPPRSSITNSSTHSTANASTPTLYPDNTSAHPCPNAGYSCSECPGGVFCPPTQTSALDCVCGYGWACGHCSQGWFCMSSPTSSANAFISSAAAVLGNTSGSQLAFSSVPSTMASFTPNLLSLPSAAFAIMNTGAESMSAFPTSSRPLNQATTTTRDLAGNIINSVNSALGNVDGLSGTILSSVMGQLSSVLGANFPLGNANPTSLGDPGGNLITSATGAAGNVLSNGAAAVSNPAGCLIPTTIGIGGNPNAGLVPTATALISSVASQLVAAGVPGANNPAGGFDSTAAGIIAAVNSDLLAADVPNATSAPLFQPSATRSATIPVINNMFPVLGKAVQQQATKTVIPQPLPTSSVPINPSTPASTAAKDEPNVISHLTTTIQSTPTVLPVVITILNGKPTVVPLLKIVIDGREKDLPVVGVDLGAGIGRVEAVKGVLDGKGAADSDDGKRSRGRGR
ncbi:hypothetical protein BKA65DRAFT_509741 [Rhexocercosporidium sp. MPI-PUGE-AT-0058]|nr:hypothetical protein BKA65DRAFT_509741 [Rhexocercosporidium sp. MPI-PUGE-AT-0058]